MRLLDRIFKGRKPSRLNKLAGALLNLSFINTNKLDTRITFGRTSNATVTGPNGLVAYAPHNLLTYSEQFDNAAWVKNGATVTANAIAAPNGTITADKLIASATSGPHVAFRPAVSTVAASTNTVSCYAKAGEYGFLALSVMQGSDSNGICYTFNLTNGSINQVRVQAYVGVSAYSQDVGNGWWRCSITFTNAVSTADYVNIAPSPTATPALNDVYVSASYTGDGTSGIYVWGAQLERSSTATTYNPTTVKNLLGYTEHFDNAAWTKSNAFVQTNLLLQSNAFTTSPWSLGGTPVLTANATTAPDGTIAGWSLATNGNNIIQSVSVTSGMVYTFSLYVKQGNTSFIGGEIAGASTGMWSLNFSTLVVTVNNSISNGTATDVGNGWYRVSVRITAASTGTLTLFQYGSQNFGSSGTAFIYGAQLVQGTSAGDYKATYAAAAAVGYSDIYGQPFAQKLVASTATSAHFTSGDANVVSGTKYTASIYVKAAEYSTAIIGFLASTGFSTTTSVLVNLTEGTVSAGTGTPLFSAITNVGNGWYRISVVLAASASGAGSIYVAAVNGTTYADRTVAGDGTSGIYIFGAQLSDSASVDPYVYNPVAAPTAQAYYGPRFDYDASAATYTEQFGAELLGAAAVGLVGSATAATYSTTTGVGTVTRVDASNQSFVKWSSLSGGFYKVTVACTSGVAISVRSGPQTGTTIATILSGSSATVFVPPTSGEISITSSSGTAGFTVTSVKEYLGTTGTGTVPKGLLIEEQRTNLFLQSQFGGAGVWNISNVAMTANAAIAPDGTVTAESLVPNTTAGVSHSTVQITTATLGVQYAYSVYAKANGYTNIQFFGDSSGNFTATFDLTAGNAAFGGSATAASITPVGNGWYRCVAIFTMATSARLNVQGFPTGATASNYGNTFTGNGTSGVYLWGAQLEAGAFATSYIPTVASQVTRAADSASMIGNNFARWYNLNEGTAYAQYDIAGYSSFNPVFDIGADQNNLISMSLNSSVNSRMVVVAGGTTQANIALGAASANTVYKQANAYKVDDFAATRNGASVLADTLGTIPVVNQAAIGGTVGLARSLNGHISRIAYYPRRLSNAELQGITS